MGTSFGSATPLTPPTALAPAANWQSGADFKYNLSAAPFVAASDLDHAAPLPQYSFVSEDFVAAPQMPFAAPNMFQPAYEAMDPTLAFIMYNAASAAAQAAAQQHMLSQGMYPAQPEVAPTRGSRRVEAEAMQSVPTFEDLQAVTGSLIEHARSAAGSSFIQAAVKDSADPRCIQLVWAELSPCLGDLLLDAHGCYVVKTLLERLSPAEVAYVLESISSDEQLGFSVCTHSLHTRRVVQHIIESIDGNFLCELMSRHCAEIATTQQGCIVMQRSMDHAPPGPHRDPLFASIATHLVRFAKDPFANYVVQHLMEVGDRAGTSEFMWKAFQGHVVELACNKFASNVIEKCLFHCTAEIQHDILTEMYSVGHQGLYNMLQDSFGNYIIQSSIALATFRDVSLIDERLRPVLAHTPYGYKIEARLDRRLKGKPVTARAPAPQAAPSNNNGSKRRGGRGEAKVPEGEVAW